jgi:hypothetical protein
MIQRNITQYKSRDVATRLAFSNGAALFKKSDKNFTTGSLLVTNVSRLDKIPVLSEKRI